MTNKPIDVSWYHSWCCRVSGYDRPAIDPCRERTIRSTSVRSGTQFLSGAMTLMFALAGCNASQSTAADRAPRELQSLRLAESKLVEQRQLSAGAATQGLALADDYYYSADTNSVYRYNKNWELLEEKSIRIEGVNHLGAIHYHEGVLWGGLLNGPTGDLAIIVKIRARDLQVVQTWDITGDVTWIDPVCFDGKHLWVGDLSDLGIHRYHLVDGELVRDGVFRYPGEMHFSQGIRVVGNRLYTIHTFGSMDGLYEFVIPDKLTSKVNQPIRFWMIEETRMHLEGFDFVPDHPDHIWHAQGGQVDRYQLSDIVTEGSK